MRAKEKFLKRHYEENKDCNKAIFDLYPKFSFEYNVGVGTSRNIERREKAHRVAILNKLVHLSKQTWKEISQLPKEQGYEKIPKSSFKSLPSLPNKFSEVTQIDVFRIGDCGRLIGYIEDEVFYIVWIDVQFDMYDH
ncbi:hypothetical protein [Litoribacillus peritrichatus]|uniref:Uncharacterized protein n=1 Tax=Litoribacillus peritrichatus TaxID=718191 RepID=A0ABP7MXX0_9GAMM